MHLKKKAAAVVDDQSHHQLNIEFGNLIHFAHFIVLELSNRIKTNCQLSAEFLHFQMLLP